MNEKRIKVIDPKGRMHKRKDPTKEFKPMSFATNSLATNVELYDLPLKAVKKDDFMVRLWPEGGSIIGQRKPIL